MNVALWVVASLLAAVLLGSSAKVAVPKERMISMGGGASAWVENFTPRAIKTIGVFEFLGAAGLVLPAVLNVVPGLVPVAASGAVALFIGAVVVRVRRRERVTVLLDLVFLAMAAFVAWGRFGPRPFTG